MNAFDEILNSQSLAEKMRSSSDSAAYHSYVNDNYLEDNSELELLGFEDNIAHDESIFDPFSPLSHIKTNQYLNMENDKLKQQMYVHTILLRPNFQYSYFIRHFYQQKLETYENYQDNISQQVEQPIIQR